MKKYRQTTGFIYLWMDTVQKKFYLGSHLGSPNDNYIGSNYRLQCAHKSRPNTFKRRILELYSSITSKELIQREQMWLNKIKPEELNIKYYNEKNVASGGDIISNLSLEKRRQHAEKSGLAAKKYWDTISEEDYKKRQENAFGGNIFDRSYMKKCNNINNKIKLENRGKIDAFMTPLGPRPFLTKAAIEFGISYQYLRKLVDSGKNGYYWLNKTGYFYK